MVEIIKEVEEYFTNCNNSKRKGETWVDFYKSEKEFINKNNKSLLELCTNLGKNLEHIKRKESFNIKVNFTDKLKVFAYWELINGK